MKIIDNTYITGKIKDRLPKKYIKIIITRFTWNLTKRLSKYHVTNIDIGAFLVTPIIRRYTVWNYLKTLRFFKRKGYTVPTTGAEEKNYPEYVRKY
jgi:hypothetical protein